MPILTGRDGTLITKWEDWTRPKRDYQWAEGRSAMEVAKSWFRDETLSPPEELLRLLTSHERFADLHLTQGRPEFVTHLPEKGEGRNHDLWLQGRTHGELVTIYVEAKADEPFGNRTVEEYRRGGINRQAGGLRSGVPDRIEKLLQMVPAGDWDRVMYQLLTAICGTGIQTKKDGASVGIFAVHEFHTAMTKAENLRRNQACFEYFLRVLGFDGDLSVKDRLFGPIRVAGAECYVGKTLACPTT
jgi:hypothetical protein